MSSLAAVVLAGAASLAMALALLASAHLHGHLTYDWIDGAQKVHRRPTPRLGALTILAGVSFGALALPGGPLGLILAASLPAVAAGLAEDLTGRVRPAVRLVATLVSGLAISCALGQIPASTGLPLLDAALAVAPVGLAVTVLAIGGLAHAINLIDGLNGLAAGTALIALAALGGVAALAGDVELAAAIATTGGAVTAFLVLNFPVARLFLGDAGAYLLGILLGGFAVALAVRNPAVSPLVTLVALGYPVSETLVSITRRRLAGRRASAADGGHLHSLIHRRIAEPIARAAGSVELGNPLATVLIWPLAVFAGGLAFAGLYRPEILPAAFGLALATYLAGWFAVARPGLASSRPASPKRHTAPASF